MAENKTTPTKVSPAAFINHLKSLADVDRRVLRTLVEESVAAAQKRYPQS